MDENALCMNNPSDKLLAVPVFLDSTFFSTLNTHESKEYQCHTWNADLELLPFQNDSEAEKMDTSSSDQHSQDSVELIIEKLLNQNAAGLVFIPESEMVKILQFVIKQKRNEEQKSFSKDMYTLLNVIFSASFDDAILVKYLRNLNVEETLIALDLLLLYIQQTDDVSNKIKKPGDLQVVNWMCLLLSSHTEALLLTKERAAKKTLKDLKKALSLKMKEYEDLEEVENYFSILKKNIDILPQQSSVEKYYVEILNIN